LIVLKWVRRVMMRVGELLVMPLKGKTDRLTGAIVNQGWIPRKMAW
jgi:hypothetical protein